MLEGSLPLERRERAAEPTQSHPNISSLMRVAATCPASSIRLCGRRLPSGKMWQSHTGCLERQLNLFTPGAHGWVLTAGPASPPWTPPARRPTCACRPRAAAAGSLLCREPPSPSPCEFPASPPVPAPVDSRIPTTSEVCTARVRRDAAMRKRRRL